MPKLCAVVFIEVLFIDDCSTDASLSLLEQKLTGQEVKILQTDNNSGRPAIPRNIGLENTICDRVVFLDIDDLINPEACWLYRQLADDVIISGIKTAKFTKVYPWKTYNIPRFLIEMKNPINLSGSSIAKIYFVSNRFENTILEDWLVWRGIKNKYPEAKFIYSNNLQIKYNNNITLSPPKIKQMSRVISCFGFLGFLSYLLGLALMKLYILRIKLSTKGVA